jgi:alkyldihydroxyacetonephosphate synthase
MTRRSERIAHAVSQAVPGLRTSGDDADRALYARDLWPRHHLSVRAGSPAEHRPGAIAWPASTEDVASLVRWAAREGVPLVPFGAGSGVCAGVLPREDVVIVDLKRMARIRSLAKSAPSVEVEAGHMGLPFESALGREGFTLGHFPSSILCSTVGGWVAARSAGQCSGAYGKIEDMVAGLECVTGRGEVVVLRRRTNHADLTPLMIGSEGTLGVVTSATLRLHPAPTDRAFGSWSFPTTPHGIDAMRALFQAGLRPAVARLYDPFDAMLARQHSSRTTARPDPKPESPFSGAALRAILRRPGALNDLLALRATERALGGAMLVVIFEGGRGAPERGLARARRIIEPMLGRWRGEDAARHWLERRYSISYRQAPMFARGAFVDTMEVAAPWSKIVLLYDAVRQALGRHVFVMAHFSHAYPDGCCIYFSFAGSADPGLAGEVGWDPACEATYDRAWRAALGAAVDAGGTLAHHHGVGRSKAPRLQAELGTGIDVVRSLMHAFDPAGIMNPGNLLPEGARTGPVAPLLPPSPQPAGGVRGPHAPLVDRESLLARFEGTDPLGTAERSLNFQGLTLDVRLPPGTEGLTVGEWLALGAPGARDAWLDPVDHLLAGLDARLHDGRTLKIRPSPRRAVGPDLTILFVGARGRFGRIDRAWLRVHRLGVERPVSPPFDIERDPELSGGESALLDAIAASLTT